MVWFSATNLLLAFLLVVNARPNDRKVDVRRVATISNRYGDELLDVLGSEEGNIFYSPLSISTMLSSLYIGSRGHTREEIGRIGYSDLEERGVSVPRSYEELFGIQQDNPDQYKLESANALFTKAGYRILDEYKGTLTSSYHTFIREVDFVEEGDQAVQMVNDWVNERTYGKIEKLVDELDKSTVLVLLNAIYFKGTWKHEFDSKDTKQNSFYNNGNDNPKQVSTMHVRSKYPYLYDEENQLRVLQMPYKGKDVSMVIVLPMERDGVKRVQREITSDRLYDIINRLKETEVKVSLPKFKLEYSRTLTDDIRETGITSIFEPTADLSGITGSRNLQVSSILHKAAVEVNEEGSEAAAVTGTLIVGTSLVLPTDRYEFKADHPFMFYIVDHRTNTNLFVGRVSEL